MARIWVNGPAGGTPLSANRLNGMETDIGSAVGDATAAKGLADVSALAATAAKLNAAKAQADAELAAQRAEDAVIAAAGGGVAVDPGDPDALIISTRADGSIIVDPADTDALQITI